jgi:hypothetical protein
MLFHSEEIFIKRPTLERPSYFFDTMAEYDELKTFLANRNYCCSCSDLDNLHFYIEDRFGYEKLRLREFPLPMETIMEEWWVDYKKEVDAEKREGHLKTWRYVCADRYVDSVRDELFEEYFQQYMAALKTDSGPIRHQRMKNFLSDYEKKKADVPPPAVSSLSLAEIISVLNALLVANPELGKIRLATSA